MHPARGEGTLHPVYFVANYTKNRRARTRAARALRAPGGRGSAAAHRASACLRFGGYAEHETTRTASAPDGDGSWRAAAAPQAGRLGAPPSRHDRPFGPGRGCVGTKTARRADTKTRQALRRGTKRLRDSSRSLDPAPDAGGAQQFVAPLCELGGSAREIHEHRAAYGRATGEDRELRFAHPCRLRRTFRVFWV